MSTKAQLGKIAEVRGITECSAGQAGELLKAVGWSVERAVDRFYELGMRAEGAPAPVVPAGSGAAKAATGGGASAKAAPTKLESEFKAYEDPEDPGRMNGTQIEAFASDLGIDPFSDVTILVIMYHMGCADQGVITADEFAAGFKKMGVDSVAALKSKLRAAREDMFKKANFDAFYRWCYKFNCEPGQKTLRLEAAVALTPMVLSPAAYPLVPEWIAFLESQAKTVSRDTWDMILEFFRTIKPDLSNYDDTTSSWPLQVDEFVDFLRKKGIGKKK